MKKTVFIFIFLFFTIVSFAQLNYQIIVRNGSAGTSADLLSNGNVYVKAEIYAGDLSTAAGVLVYSEEFNKTTTEYGLVNLIIGDGIDPNSVSHSGNYSDILWYRADHYLRISLDIGHSGTYTPYREEQVASVPYALYADSVRKTEYTGHYIGEEYQGGIIFALEANAAGEYGKAGLIVSLADLTSTSTLSDASPTMKWGSKTNITTTMYDGEANIAAIKASNGGNLSGFDAAKACDDYSITISGTAYNDWYLPSIWEFYKLLEAAYVVSIILDNYTGSTAWITSATTKGLGWKKNTNVANNTDWSMYWTSTQYNRDNAFIFNISAIKGGAYSKTNNSRYKVRAIRRFSD
jgi:hypothetical protein